MRDYLSGSSDVLAELTTRERLAGWEQTIRTTCETLVDAAARDVAAASVTLSHGVEGEVALLCGLVEEIAEEYGVAVSFKLGDEIFTARFTRDSDGAPGR